MATAAVFFWQIIDWLNAVIDAHGPNLLMEDRFMDEMEELSSFVVDSVSLFPFFRGQWRSQRGGGAGGPRRLGIRPKLFSQANRFGLVESNSSESSLAGAL